MRDVNCDDEFLTRVSTFIEALDIHSLRVEWGDDVFEHVVAYVWKSIPGLVLRVSVLGQRSSA